MSHLIIALFFITIFIGVGVAAQLMVKEYWDEIVNALLGKQPARKPIPSRFTVTVRPRPAFAQAMRPRGAAF